MEIIKNVWQIWKRFGRFVGDFIGRLILTIFYFTIFAPFGMGVRFFGDPLEIRKEQGTKWIERNTRDLSVEDTWRLF
jgi:hypothetical protein